MSTTANGAKCPLGTETESGIPHNLDQIIDQTVKESLTYRSDPVPKPTFKKRKLSKNTDRSKHDPDWY